MDIAQRYFDGFFCTRHSPLKPPGVTASFGIVNFLTHICNRLLIPHSAEISINPQILVSI